VQGTPGGGVGGYGAGAPGAGAAAPRVGAGGCWCRRGRPRAVYLGAGTPLASYDPALTLNMGIEHSTSPLSNQTVFGVSSLHLNTGASDSISSQAFPTGTTVSLRIRPTTGRRETVPTPTSCGFELVLPLRFRQELLAGFGFGPIALLAHREKITEDFRHAFKDQAIATVTQIENIYWDLVSAYQQARVNEQSLAFANSDPGQRQKAVEVGSHPEMDVMKAEAEASKRDQDLTVAAPIFQLQESLMKNALTRTLDNPTLEEMPVVPTDQMQPDTEASEPILDLIDRALRKSSGVAETDIDLATGRSAEKLRAMPAFPPRVGRVLRGTGLGESQTQQRQIRPTCHEICLALAKHFHNSSRIITRGQFEHSIPDRVAKGRPIPVRTRVSPVQACARSN